MSKHSNLRQLDALTARRQTRKATRARKWGHLMDADRGWRR